MPAKAFIPCVLKDSPEPLIARAQRAIEINPTNAPMLHPIHLAVALYMPPERLAVLTGKYWGSKGVDLSVYFMDTESLSLQNRILDHMNAWGMRSNVRFRLTQLPGQVRIARTRGEGYWSYLGTDILGIPAHQATMNLDSFTMTTPESEFLRVVRHETGHTLGFPHEHLREAVVRRLDRAKTIRYFRDRYGWTESLTVHNVLTPISEQELIANAADVSSIMAYQLPAEITTDGKPIKGGADINDHDHELCGKIYPSAEPPPPPPPPPLRGVILRYTAEVPPTVVEIVGWKCVRETSADEGRVEEHFPPRE